MAAHGISDTAFLTCAMRSELADLSKDRYAERWVTEGAIELLNNFRQNVDVLGERIVSLRNRYFFEEAQKFFGQEFKGQFVSIAAGFNNYPFLFNRSIPALEVDFEDIVSLKKSKLDEWIAEQSLPNRKVDFIGTDLSNPDNIRQLAADIKTWLGDNTAFVLLEGIVYYLKEDIVKLLMDCLAEFLPDGSILAFDFWKPDMGDHPIFHALQPHFSVGDTHPAENYFLFGEAFLKQFPRYKLESCWLIDEVEAMFTQDRRFTSYANTFPDYLAVLRTQPAD